MPTKKINFIACERRTQYGMTLIVGLVMLAMLMLLGTLGYRNIILSERITANAYDRNIAFQAAENAGKEAIELIETGLPEAMQVSAFDIAALLKSGLVPPVYSAPPAGLYRVPLLGGGSTFFWTQGDGMPLVDPLIDCRGASSFNWKSCSATVANRYFTSGTNAQYVIELLPSISTDGKMLTYRVSSRSTGASGAAEVVLQSIYSRNKP